MTNQELDDLFYSEISAMADFFNARLTGQKPPVDEFKNYVNHGYVIHAEALPASPAWGAAFDAGLISMDSDGDYVSKWWLAGTGDSD